MEDRVEFLRSRLRIQDKLTRNVLAELFGTFLLLFIGDGIVAQFILSKRALNIWININIGWGAAVAFCVICTMYLSGGHLNPAVSLLMYTYGRLNIVELILYIIVQTIGALFGAAGVYIVYYDAINYFEGGSDIRTVGPNGTAGIFATYPEHYISMGGAFLDQVVGTGILTLLVSAVIDKRNKIPEASHPILFGAIVMLIGHCFGMNCGYPINPARDFGPRVFTFFIYGSAVFTFPNSIWWTIPILGPSVGGVLGGWLYQITCGFHVPDSKGEYGEDHKDGAAEILKTGV